MNEEQRKAMLEMIKDVKLQKGAILSNKVVDEVAEGAKKLTDDELILNMTEMFGKFATFIIISSPDQVMAAYGAAIGYYILEREAQNRELYW